MLSLGTAKIFKSGNSLAIRLPKKWGLRDGNVLVFRDGQRIVILPADRQWSDFFADPRCVEENFLDKREDTPPQEREPW